MNLTFNRVVENMYDGGYGRHELDDVSCAGISLEKTLINKKHHKKNYSESKKNNELDFKSFANANDNCSCGSGLPSKLIYKANGISVYGCNACKKDKLKNRKDVE